MNQMANLHLSRAGTVEIIGVASAAGAPVSHSEVAPDVLLAHGLPERLQALGIDAVWTDPIRLDSDSTDDPVSAVRSVCTRVAERVETSVARGHMPLVLGGDHSCAIGTWKGVARAFAERGPVGLVWVDAHMDAHTPLTSHTGALHGMPLACLLGHGHPRLVTLSEGLCLSPEHVCLIGVRSYEPGEAELLQRLGVRVFFMDEIERRGLQDVMREALAIVRKGTAGYGVSIDLDAIDPHDAPAVATPVAAGIPAAHLQSAMETVAHDPALVALEIVEYTPPDDPQAITAEVAMELMGTVLGGSPERRESARLIGLEYRHGAHHYDILPVVFSRGRGVYLWDIEGRRYLDMLSAYSAVSHGHCHPRLVRALAAQARRLTLTSRVFHNDRLPHLLKRLCEITKLDLALPVNTGLEAVEAALKTARKWAHTVKGVPQDRAEIIACEGNFHGRSIAIVAMSSEPQYRASFGPFPPGFKKVPFGDAAALERAITPYTAAFLVEPIQGEGGINVPPAGYLAQCRDICRRHNVLLICDEVQTGLGRTGRMLASEHEGVIPDGLILGKALGGGLLPVSAFVGRREVMQVLRPGDHGSTFGGNPLAAAVALEAIDILIEDRLPEHCAELGIYFMEKLRALASPLVREVRGRGLLIGMEIDPSRVSARDACRKLLEHGIITKDTHHRVLRFAPPLIITRRQIDAAVAAVRRALEELEEESAHG